MLRASGYVNDVITCSHSGPNTNTGVAPATQRIIRLDSPGSATKLRTRERSLLSPVALFITVTFVCRSREAGWLIVSAASGRSASLYSGRP